MSIKNITRFLKKKSVIFATALVVATGTIYEVKFNKPPEPTRYVLAAVTRGTLVTAVTGSGQVSGLNQVDVKPTVSGEVMKILVKPGTDVKKGTPLFEIKSTTAEKSIRDATQSVNDAKLSLQSSELSLKKLKQPPDAVTLVQATNAVNQAKRALADLKDGTDALDIAQAEAEYALQLHNAKLSPDGTTPQVVRDAYDDAVAVVKNTSQTLQQALLDADVILGVDNPNLNDAYEKLLSIQDSNRLGLALNAYPIAKKSVTLLKTNADALKTTDENVLKISATLADSRSAIGVMDGFLRQVTDVLMATIASASFSQSNLDGLRSTILSDRTNVTSKLSTLTSQAHAIEQAQSSYDSARLTLEKSRIALEKLKRGADASDIASAEERVVESQASLAKLQKGTDVIDIAMSENSMAQRRSSLTSAEHKLADARETLADYTVRAPFDGVIAVVPVKEAEQASPSTVLATLLTQAKIAEIPLNEVDVAKVRVDQKATLTFDAVPDLTIAGTVMEVDAIGTVNQGVVTYNVKIAFVTQDDRVKTGMSASASVITDIRQNVLLVPNAAIQRVSGSPTVQTLVATGTDALSPQGVTSDVPPASLTVQTGLANEQMTEITNGLKEGDRIVVRTIMPSTTAANTATGQSSSAAVRIPGLGGGGTGNRTFTR